MSSASKRLILTVLLQVVWLAGLLPQPVRAEPIPEQARVKGLVGRAQLFNLSCESRSAVDWARYWGVNIREQKFLRSLPRSDNPDRGFVGNPNGAWGNIPPAAYGVHAEPVAAALREFGLDALARRGMTWNDLRTEIAAGRPVIVWVIGLVWAGSSQKYRARDGTVTVVARYEHTVIVTGYSPTEVTLVDAATGYTHKFSKRAFMRSWSTLGYMAVTGSGLRGQEPPNVPVPTDRAVEPVQKSDLTLRLFLPAVLGGSVRKLPSTPPAGIPETYVVRRGEYLIGVAKKFGLSWMELARKNGLTPPYVLFTGQVLKLK